MTEPVTFYCQGNPIGQGSKSVGKTSTGQAFLRDANAARLRPWRAAVKAAAKEAMAGRSLLIGPVVVTATFAYDRPKNQKGQRTWPSGKGPGIFDVDKSLRAVFDAMTGTVYVDDVQVVSVTARKVWAEYDVDWLPGVLVWVNHVPGFTVPDPVSL